MLIELICQEQIEYDYPSECTQSRIRLLLTVTDILTTYAEVIFGLRTSYTTTALARANTTFKKTQKITTHLFP